MKLAALSLLQEQFEVQKTHRSKGGCHDNLMFLDQSNNYC